MTVSVSLWGFVTNTDSVIEFENNGKLEKFNEEFGNNGEIRKFNKVSNFSISVGHVFQVLFQNE
jgi:hypothetical protein